MKNRRRCLKQREKNDATGLLGKFPFQTVQRVTSGLTDSSQKILFNEKGKKK